MLIDDVSLGVKFGRTLGSCNALLVTAKRKSWKRLREIGEGMNGRQEASPAPTVFLKQESTVLCGVLGFDGSL